MLSKHEIVRRDKKMEHVIKIVQLPAINKMQNKKYRSNAINIYLIIF